MDPKESPEATALIPNSRVALSHRLCETREGHHSPPVILCAPCGKEGPSGGPRWLNLENACIAESRSTSRSIAHVWFERNADRCTSSISVDPRKSAAREDDKWPKAEC
jgi:hypothetical protein